MSRIRILPEQLANQIAAGEVVERPASVVKELLENSLDAGATRVEIAVEGAGTGLIRLIDNGEGMEEDDVLLSLERHGTSKISSDDDLLAISTLGFRGEAIPSIGAVAKMTITSRRAESELGTRAEIHYGKLIKVHEAGCAPGTIIEIKNLFGNTPARKKFLRTARTELGHIDEIVRNYALARPEVTFILSVNDKQILHLDRTLSLADRLARLLNSAGRFITIESSAGGSHGRQLHGLFVPPERLMTGPARLRLFVNGRAVKDRLMMHGVIEGLRGFLMKGRNPAGFLHLSLPPAEVDVNVHPAKQEVRFRNSRDIHFFISDTVARAMAREQRVLQSTMFGRSLQPETTPIPPDHDRTDPGDHQPRPAAAETTGTNGSPAPREAEGPQARVMPALAIPGEKLRTAIGPGQSQRLAESFYEPAPPRRRQEKDHEPGQHKVSGASAPPQLMEPFWRTAEPSRPQADDLPAEAEVSPRQSSLLSPPVSGHGLEVIGQFADLYIFCRNHHNQLLVIDQHAAHERLLFEELRHHYLGATIPRQNLLFPETVDLTVFQARLVEQHDHELDQLGFSLREFGGTSYLISAIPALAGNLSPTRLLTDVLEQFGGDNDRRQRGDIIDTILATMACKAAVKGGTALTVAEIDALLVKMAKADLFSHCPHGRPVVKIFSQKELQKWFHRL
ncbi:MAG: DNA mismatch repair endonuclease MutL [Desulfopila sp.]